VQVRLSVSGTVAWRPGPPPPFRKRSRPTTARSVNKQEAREVLEQETGKLRGRGYEELRASLLGESETLEVVGASESQGPGSPTFSWRNWGRNGSPGKGCAAAEPFTPGRFIRPRVMLGVPSVREPSAIRPLAPESSRDGATRAGRRVPSPPDLR
jgi:hypothetical protein